MSYVRKHFERYLTEAEEKAFFDYVRQFSDVLARRDVAWMTLMRQTGIRVTPMSLLTVSDAKKALSKGYLHVRPEINKRGKGYTVRLNKEAKKQLQVLILIRIEMGYSKDDTDAPLVMSRNHAGMSVRSYQTRMKYWLTRAGVNTHASPHWLRHTLSKRLIKHSTSSNPLGIVQAALGHSSIASSAVYAMPDKEELEAAMEAAS